MNGLPTDNRPQYDPGFVELPSHVQPEHRHAPGTPFEPRAYYEQQYWQTHRRKRPSLVWLIVAAVAIGIGVTIFAALSGKELAEQSNGDTDAYLSILRSEDGQGTGAELLSDSDAIDAGHEVCSMLDAGQPMLGVALTVSAQYGLSAEGGGMVLGAAVMALCNEYMDELTELAEG